MLRSCRLLPIVTAGFLLVLALAVASAATTDESVTRYVRVPASLMDADGHTLGTLRIGTELEVLDAVDGDRLEVALHGWSWSTGPQIVFVSPERRIELARLSVDGAAEREVAGSRNDPFGIPWDEVTVRGFVDAASLLDDVNVLWAQAQALHQDRCTDCHTAYPATRLPVYRWADRMTRVCGTRASLPPARTELLTKYLEYHARDR